MRSSGKAMKEKRLGLNASIPQVAKVANLSNSVVMRVEAGHKYPQATYSKIWDALKKLSLGEVKNPVVKLMKTYVQSKGSLGAIKRKERINGITH